MVCNPLGKLVSTAFAKAKRRRSLHSREKKSRDEIVKRIIPGDNVVYVGKPIPGTPVRWIPSDTLPEPVIHPSAHALSLNSSSMQTMAIYEATDSPEFDSHNEIPSSRSYDDRSSSSYGGSPGSGPFGRHNKVHYPSALRQGICKLDADGGNLSTIFSDENPNACNIV